MSYCRWSDCGFQSDVYAYESSDGFVVHMASSRYTVPIPEHDFSSPEAMNRANAERKEAFANTPRVPIGLPHDGDTFYCGSLEILLARLLHLREVGYRVPDHAIELVTEEMNEEAE